MPAQAPSSRRIRLTRIAITASVLAATCAGLGQDADRYPPPADKTIDFHTDIQPILQRACLRCHGPEEPKSGFRLDRRDLALKGGEYGVAIVPGDSANSELIYYVARVDEDFAMPPKKEDALSREEVGLLRAWIDQGLNWPETTTSEFEPKYSFTPIMRYFSVDGDSAQFQRHTGIEPGWTGGLEEFRYAQKLNDTSRIEVTGHVLAGNHDQGLSLFYQKDDVGFLSLGFEQYRNYYDDSGGYHPGFVPPQFELDQDLSLDIGKAWVDLGLTLPNWPEIILGYEYRYRDGEKSLTQWGAMTLPSFDLRNLYPAAKSIEEDVHLLSLEVKDEIAGIQVEDQFQFEIYDLDTSRTLASSFTPGATAPDGFESIQDSQSHTRTSNSLVLEKQLRPWMRLTGGYLFSNLDGEGFFVRNNVTPFFVAAEPFSNDIVLDQQTHVFNVNALFGPWEQFTVSTGVQAQWLRQDGVGKIVHRSFDGIESKIASDLDQSSFTEQVALRYTGLPRTVWFADLKLQQEAWDQFEENPDAFEGFLRDTDAEGDTLEYRTGWHFSPIPKLSMKAQIGRKERGNDYDHKTDLSAGGLPGSGYGAFIQSRDTDENYLSAKISYRATSWLKTSLNYQLSDTEYSTKTAAFSEPFLGIAVPEGTVFAGNYDAHHFSVNATLTPWRRFYLSSTLSYVNSRIHTADNDVAAMSSYQGDVYNVLASATYLINERTDLKATYSLSLADYSQDHFATGLPLGMEYTWHQVTVGLRRQMNEYMTGQLTYAFYDYDEPWSRGLNDYQAHGVFAVLQIHQP